ncbi:MAG TPA: SWIM zinc finger domain-containing protein [Smithellaceae bacterium]|nr:SWIM zinc finger domain-containing protein [Smithellaceae bacterium]
MTSADITQRSNKSNGLKMFQAEDGQYYVESAEGKICYRVSGNNGSRSCTCGDYTSMIAKDPTFQCKHILAVINGNGNIKNVQMARNQSPKLDERFIIKIKAKEFVLYTGLLDLAHQKGIKRITVEAVQYPTKDNKLEAICKATVESKDGELFVEIADANPLNVNRMVVEHILRVAATRAKARALRDFTNIGMTCLEELGELDDLLDDDTGKSRMRRREPRTETVTTEATTQAPPKQEQQKGGATTHDRRIKEAQQAKKETDKVSEATGKASSTGAPASSKREKNPKASDPENTEAQIKPSEAQVKAIEKLAERRGISGEQIVKIFTDKFQKPYVEINADEAKNFIKHLQQAA